MAKFESFWILSINVFFKIAYTDTRGGFKAATTFKMERFVNGWMEGSTR